MQGFAVAIKYLVIIGIGYLLKCLHVIKEQEAAILGRVILYLTLPAVIITSFSQSTSDRWMLLSLAIGFCGSALVLLATVLCTGKLDREARAMYALNCAGMNLGNITIPFLTSALPGAVVYAGMFATGDSFIALGGNYAVAEILLSRKSGNPFTRLVRALLSSPPFLAYAIMAILVLCGVQLPAFFTDFCGTVGNANTLLCMLFIGLSLNFSRGKVNGRQVVAILLIRLAASVVLFTLAMTCLRSAPLLMRQAIAVSVFSAIPNVCLVYVSKLGLDTATAGLANTISSILAIPLLSLAMWVSGIL